ncbi:DUF2802 domain-containing protein [Methylomonas methanica]|uniref:DUF2802 domain-containing protein n=1 Tax=Methylomonas methanica (strain DSM 25384 / MC09) TaxID=857087 RepID=G0A0A0_METMM|nr:DUF2802 domain-containing protein [Methylomonas methanica]AEG02406.1 hypothetical protein Metme_4053 [Methylomonas methanica MC09]
MNELVLLALAGVVLVLLVLAAALFSLWRQQKRLKQEYQLLRSQLQRSSDDVAGLCAAAIAVDKRLSESETHLNQMLDAVNAPEPEYNELVVAKEEDPQGGYSLAIEKIHRGASLDELVKSCGLTRDEAVLLMRLHGQH